VNAGSRRDAIEAWPTVSARVAVICEHHEEELLGGLYVLV
jgi:hypothetical protein